MTRRQRFIDFLWGDVAPLPAFLRTCVKIAFAFVLGWMSHEWVLVPIFFSMKSTVTANLEREFAEASSQLPKGAEEFVLCLVSSQKSGQPICSKLALVSYTEPMLGYEIWQVEPVLQRVQSGQFFEIERNVLSVSSVTINSSVDGFLRAIEAAVFNSGKSPTQFELCAGTRTVLDESKCKVTSRIGQILRGQIPKDGPVNPNETAKPDSLKSQADSVRVGALIVGVIQFGTVCVFIYCILETFGLWLRWVQPPDVLFKVVERDGGASIVIPDLEVLRNAVSRFGSSRIRSLGDRLFARLLVAEGHQSETPTGGPNIADPEARPELAATLDSYRNYLQDDAMSRQEALEVLSDTMLKLAFMGTVFGISEALYSARELDSADPLARLLAKSEMYSGIGIGFGATLVGILLSIAASTTRSWLSENWIGEIGMAYRLILDLGAPSVKSSVSLLSSHELALLSPLRVKRQRAQLGMLGAIGMIVTVVMCFGLLLAVLRRI